MFRAAYWLGFDGGMRSPTKAAIGVSRAWQRCNHESAVTMHTGLLWCHQICCDCCYTAKRWLGALQGQREINKQDKFIFWWSLYLAVRLDASQWLDALVDPTHEHDTALCPCSHAYGRSSGW